MRYILLIFAASIFISCSEEKKSADIITELNTSDTFLFDIPPPSKETRIESRRRLEWDERRKSLDLERIDYGFDSVQIRIWYGGTINGQRLIILTNKHKKWSAEIFKFFQLTNPEYKKKEDSLVARFTYKGSSYYAAPKSGWSSFIKRIFALGIVSMPDERKVNEPAGVVFDGWGIVIEVATKNAFRSYSYSNPDLYYKVCPECKSVCEIVKLIEDEFHLLYITDFEKVTNQ